MTSLNVQPYYIGLLSGTSMDGIDAVLVDFTASMPQLISTHSSSLPPSLQPIYQQILANKPMDLLSLGKLDHELGLSFAKAANNLLAQANIGKNQVAAIVVTAKRFFIILKATYPLVGKWVIPTSSQLVQGLPP